MAHVEDLDLVVLHARFEEHFVSLIIDGATLIGGVPKAVLETRRRGVFVDPSDAESLVFRARSVAALYQTVVTLHADGFTVSDLDLADEVEWEAFGLLWRGGWAEQRAALGSGGGRLLANGLKLPRAGVFDAYEIFDLVELLATVRFREFERDFEATPERDALSISGKASVDGEAPRGLKFVSFCVAQGEVFVLFDVIEPEKIGEFASVPTVSRDGVTDPKSAHPVAVDGASDGNDRRGLFRLGGVASGCIVALARLRGGMAGGASSGKESARQKKIGEQPVGVGASPLPVADPTHLSSVS